MIAVIAVNVKTRAWCWLAARCTAAGLVLLLAGGCPKPRTPDANAQVFETPDQVGARRQAEQQTAFQALALEMVRLQRPDLAPTTQPGAPTEIHIEADGAAGALRLPQPTDWSMPASRKNALLQESLRPQIADFDQQRLKAMGFAKARKALMPQLLADGEGTESYRVSRAGELHWTAVVVWPRSASVSYIGPAVLEAWKVAPDALDRAALENVAELAKPQNVETLSFGGTARLGSVKPGVNPAMILAPQFLAMVRQEWKTNDELVLLISSRTDVRFLARKEQRLLKDMSPGWRQRVQTVQGVLCRDLLVLGDQGIAILPPAPPATGPTTRRP